MYVKWHLPSNRPHAGSGQVTAMHSGNVGIWNGKQSKNAVSGKYPVVF